MKTTDSNTWGGASGHTYSFTRQPDGTTAVDLISTESLGGRGELSSSVGRFHPG
jgi:hypothetical protein